MHIVGPANPGQPLTPRSLGLGINVAEPGLTVPPSPRGLPTGIPPSPRGLPTGPPEGSLVYPASGSRGAYVTLPGQDAQPRSGDCLTKTLGGFCCEPADQQPELKWSYVGEGRGEYAPVENYQYVGQGAGTFEPAMSQTPVNGGASGRCMMMSFCLLFTLGLLGVIIVSAAEGAAPVYDCQTNYENWTTAWSREQQAFCCARHHRGCWVLNTTALPTKPPVQGCATMCAFKDESYSCKERIEFTAKHQAAGQPDRCEQAQLIVVHDCPVCSGCPLAETDCVDLQPTMSTTPAAAPGPEQSGAVAPGSDQAGATGADEYDCDKDFLRWRKAWPDEKRAWCCVNKKRACPLSTSSTTVSPTEELPSTSPPNSTSDTAANLSWGETLA